MAIHVNGKLFPEDKKFEVYQDGKAKNVEKVDVFQVSTGKTTTVWNSQVIVYLPQFKTTFNLRTWLNAQNISAKKIKVVNKRIQPSMTTGNLSGLDVTLVNDGELRGTSQGAWALRVESTMKLVNNGYIRGAGGKGGTGGKGGKGKDKTTTSYEYLKKYVMKGCNQNISGNYWVGVIVHNGDHLLTWGGKHSGFVGNVGTAWRSISGLPGHYRKSGGVRCCMCCSHYTNFHTIERRLTKYKKYTGGGGGNGGRGGYGLCFGKPEAWDGSWRKGIGGSSGGGSSPAGGNSGGRGATGGSGGWWGAVGYSGGKGATGGGGGSAGANGIKGSPAGAAIIGQAKLSRTGLKLGKRNGATT